MTRLLIQCLAGLVFALVSVRCQAQDPLLVTSDTTTLARATCNACGSCTDVFPKPSVQFEWIEPAAGQVVPVGGTVTTSDVSGNDLPFSHSFGFDFEGRLIPDANAPANVVDTANSHGLLVMEMEQGLVPALFRPQWGDRAVLHGRWIIDCGHPDYHTELHPPALIARARISPYTGGLLATFLGLPYLTEQTYSPLNGALVGTLVQQLTLGDVLPLQAYPNIQNNPFAKSFSANYRVKLQTRTGEPQPRLYYHFMTRSGVTVTVVPPTQADPMHAMIKVSVDATKYAAAPPPDCSTTQLSFNDIDKQAGLPDGVIEASVATAAGSGLILGHPERLFLGVLYKQCSVPYGLLLNSFATADNKVLTDDSQPFPVYGWVATDPAPLHHACPKSTLAECKVQYQDCMNGVNTRGGPTPEDCAAGLLKCPKDCVLPGSQLAQLSLGLSVIPQGDDGAFTIQLDKVNTALSEAQHHLVAGAVIVTPGVHTVTVVPGIGTSLAKYTLAYGGDCDTKGNVSLALGQSKNCTVTATALGLKNQAECLKTCQTNFQDCLSSGKGPGSPTPAQCSQGLKNCQATCR